MSKHRAASLGVILGVAFLDLLGFGIIIPQLGVYGVRFGGSPFFIGLAATSYSLMQFICAPILGRISDRYGRRPVLIYSLVGAVAAYALFAVADSMATLMVSRVVAGIAGANISTAQAYVADVTTPENRAKGMGLLGMAFGLGFILGPGLGGLLGGWHGNLAIGVFCAGLSLLNLIFVVLLVPESRKAGEPERARPGLSGFMERLRLPGVGLVLLVNWISTLGFAQVESTFSVYLLTRFLAPGSTASSTLFSLSAQVEESVLRAASLKVGYLFVAMGLVGAVIQGALLGRLKMRFGEVKLLVAGLIITSGAVALLTRMPSYAAMFIPSMLMSVGTSLTNPASSSLVSRLSPKERQGELLGAFQSMGALGRIIGPSLGGLLFTLAGASAPFLSAALFIGLIALVAVRVPSPEG